MNTRVILVRHGHVEGVDPPKFRGRLDLPLTDLGIRQARATRDFIVKLGDVDAVYCSPLGRCVDTAATISGPWSLTPHAASGLTDIDYGSWQGLSHAEAAERDPSLFAAWLERPALVAIPDGESLPSVAARVNAFCKALLAQHQGEQVVVVAHDSVNRIFLLHALGLPLSRYRRIGQAPCGVSLLSHGDGDWDVASLNETAHLQALWSQPHSRGMPCKEEATDAHPEVQR